MTADVNELSGSIAKILVILSLFILVFTLLTCFANVVLFGKIFGKESKKKFLYNYFQMGYYFDENTLEKV